MSQDDRFAAGDTDRTIIRPSPGGQRVAPAAAAPPPAADPGGVAALTQTGLNPLVAAAAPLLGLALRLRNSTQQRDIEGLRDRVVREIKAFETRALAAGVTQESGRIARYALCATIDDLVLNTPWGDGSLWSKKGMVSTFHSEVWSGEGFFDILNRLHGDPGKNLDVLELMYLCLSLGFEGKLRLDRRGQSELTRIRDGIFRTIR